MTLLPGFVTAPCHPWPRDHHELTTEEAVVALLRTDAPITGGYPNRHAVAGGVVNRLLSLAVSPDGVIVIHPTLLARTREQN